MAERERQAFSSNAYTERKSSGCFVFFYFCLLFVDWVLFCLKLPALINYEK